VLQRLHETYLQGVGAAWHRPGPFLEWVNTPEGGADCVEYLRQHMRHEFRRVFGYRNTPRGLGSQARIKLGAAWGWKEPRTTLFAPFWLQIFPDAHVVEVIRHPLAVAMSIRQRELEFRAGGDPATPQLEQLDYCLRLALTYVEAGERLARLTPNYRRIRHGLSRIWLGFAVCGRRAPALPNQLPAFDRNALPNGRAFPEKRCENFSIITLWWGSSATGDVEFW